MRRSGALWGVLLIFIGIMWILGSTGKVEIDLFGSLAVLWPLFIVAAGISFFISRDAHILRAVVWVVVFCIIGGYGFYLNRSGESDRGQGTLPEKSFEMKDSYQSGKLVVNLGAVDLDLSATDSSFAQVNTKISGIEYKLSEGFTPTLTYKQELKNSVTGSKQFTAQLNESIPWDIEVNTGATDGILDFSELALSRCVVNTGAANLEIKVGDKQKTAKLTCNSGAVDINLIVPEGSGLKIVSSAAVTNLTLNDGSGKEEFSLLGSKTYVSPNFSEAENTILLEVNSAACTVKVTTVN